MRSFLKVFEPGLPVGVAGGRFLAVFDVLCCCCSEAAVVLKHFLRNLGSSKAMCILKGSS